MPLRAVLDRAGLKPEAREVVFFGADRGPEEVEFRTQKFSVEQQYGRSMTRDQVQSSDAFLAWGLNGEPLTRHQGSPLRLLVPGWYGMANVKFLAQIHAQEDAYLGKFQARHYRRLQGEVIDGETKWTERAITHMQPKSFLARVTRNGGTHKVLGVILNDGTPIKSIEVRVDEGPWRPAVTRSVDAREIFVEAVHLRLERRHTGRTHARVARHRRQRQSAADARRAREQEDVPRGQLAVSEKDHDYRSVGDDDTEERKRKTNKHACHARSLFLFRFSFFLYSSPRWRRSRRSSPMDSSKLPRVEMPELVKLFELKPGMTVADVGAGFGAWTMEFAKVVGPTGRVYATDIGAAQLAALRDAANKHANVTVVEGAPQSTNLPPQCCDAILIRDAYHHLTQPDAIVKSLAAALKPGGRLAVIDFPPRPKSEVPSGVPADRLGHGVPSRGVRARSRRACSRTCARSRHGPEQPASVAFLVLFRKSAP